MHKGEGDNFPSAEPHLSLEDMTALSDKFQSVYSSYGKNIQAWNSCSQPFCVIPSLSSSETVKTPGKRGRKKKNPAPPPPPPEEQDSDKEAEEDMPPPATDVTPKTTGRKRKRNISRITRLINAEDDEDDEDHPPKQDPDDKDYSPSNKMVKVNTEQVRRGDVEEGKGRESNKGVEELERVKCNKMGLEESESECKENIIQMH